MNRETYENICIEIDILSKKLEAAKLSIIDLQKRDNEYNMIQRKLDFLISERRNENKIQQLKTQNVKIWKRMNMTENKLQQFITTKQENNSRRSTPQSMLDHAGG